MTRSLAALTGALGRILLAAALVAAAVPALAEDDLPSRAGRLADVAGRVYLATEERAEDWVEALRNYTITSGDNLWVAGDGRAEIDYGGGQLRLAGDTNVHVARLDDRILALFVAQGRVIVRVRVLDPGESALIDTPNTQVTLTRPGLYRIEVAPDRSRTDVVVRQGEALVQLAAGVQQVLPGQTAAVTGAEAAFADVRTGYWIDGFDTWSAERDRRYERSRSTSYVSRQMVGYADLDEFGDWQTVPEYGAVWFPTTVAAGWAPYRFGRWSWVGGWGWTWVDDAPWGYAPFHYGRWGYIGGRWGWTPGGFVARPVWSPAMVAWYGGGGWSFSASFGAPVFGWVPLGWGEPYMPWWRGCSDRCWTMYNRPYAVNYAERPRAPPTRYRNWSAPGGVTAVAGATFTGRQPVQRNLVDVKPQLVSGAPMLAQAPGVAKPTAATIPGAKPMTTAVPPPASHFYRTKPMQASPGGSGAVPPGQAGRPGTTWGGATSAPSAVAKPGAPSGATRVPPGQAVRPGSTWVDGGRPSTERAAGRRQAGLANRGYPRRDRRRARYRPRHPSVAHRKRALTRRHVGCTVRAGSQIRAAVRCAAIVGTESACCTAVAGRSEVVGAARGRGCAAPGSGGPSAGIVRAAARAPLRPPSPRPVQADRRAQTSPRRAARAISPARVSSTAPQPVAASATICGVRCEAPSAGCVDSPRSHPRACSVRPPAGSTKLATSRRRPPNALPDARIPERTRGPCSLVARSPCSPARAAMTECARRCRARRPAP